MPLLPMENQPCLNLNFIKNAQCIPLRGTKTEVLHGTAIRLFLPIQATRLPMRETNCTRLNSKIQAERFVNTAHGKRLVHSTDSEKHPAQLIFQASMCLSTTNQNTAIMHISSSRSILPTAHRAFIILQAGKTRYFSSLPIILKHTQVRTVALHVMYGRTKTRRKLFRIFTPPLIPDACFRSGHSVLSSRNTVTR